MRSLILGLSAITLGGCATIAHGPRQQIKIDSIPAKADVVINQKKAATTPCTIVLPRFKTSEITVRKSGYSEHCIVLRPYLPMTSSSAWLLLIPINTLSYAIDLLSTSAFVLRPDPDDHMIFTAVDSEFDPKGDVSIILRLEKTEQADAPNPHAFGTSGISPAEQARMPEASGYR